ncbi:hypothetical protein DFJ74DRAFT_649856 [Hyaloraphidium curvatum]|nr:hypothetical protein DFJ74DRAFT_649856 [Hyaloraphidium curvatum]
MPRLRQIALVARDLERSLHDLVHGLGLELAYRDPSVAEFGLENGVMAAGHEFIEVVAPQLGRLDTTGARFLAKKGNIAAGYMLIVQSKDARADAEHMKKSGARIAFGTEKDPNAPYQMFHMHPADWSGTGVLPSIDSANVPGASDPDSDPKAFWVAAHAPPFPPKDGKSGWEPYARRTGKYLKLVGCTLQTESKTPLEAAKRWSQLYRVPLVESHPDGGVPAIIFSNAVVRFVKARDGRGDGLQSIDLLVPNPAAARARACTVSGAKMGPDGEVELVGVWWRFKGEDEVDPRINKATGWIESAGKTPKL